jgi:serine/threonine-protein kinase
MTRAWIGVALKQLLSQSYDRTGPARLMREAQTMARLSHPNVVAVYDSGTLEDGSRARSLPGCRR